MQEALLSLHHKTQNLYIIFSFKDLEPSYIAVDGGAEES
ncbi:mCG146884 [Mus musculus]|nr:mCG146884 [Mus musculus]